MSIMAVQAPPQTVQQYPTKTTTLAPLLPPCRVCGEKASGFHYGANTCEACKGFFRRSLQRKDEYKCLANGSCRIGVGRRNACAYCRWQKCLMVGMSKTAIKTGRYTHEKKTKDIEEVKRLQLRLKAQQESPSTTFPDEDSLSSVPSSSITSPYSSATSITDTPPRSPASEEELEKIIQHIMSIHKQQTPHTPEFFEKLPEKEKEFLEQRELQQKMFGRMKPIPREEYMQIYQSTGIDIDGRREMVKHMIPCIEKSIKRFITFAKALPGFKDLPIEDQITLIKGSRFETFLISAHKAFNAEHRLYTHVCGYTLDVDELSKVHSEDYLDAVFRVAARMQRLQLSVQEECVLRGIAILSRENKLECMVLTGYRRFNIEKKVYATIYNNQFMCLEDFVRFDSLDMWKALFNFAEMMHKMSFTVEEEVMLVACNIFMADQCELTSSEQVEKSLELCVACLEYVLHRNHPEDPFIFPKAIAILTELRSVRHLVSHNDRLKKAEWLEVEFPPLIREMWTSDLNP